MYQGLLSWTVKQDIVSQYPFYHVEPNIHGEDCIEGNEDVHVFVINDSILPRSMKTSSLMKYVIGCHERLELVRQVFTHIVTMKSSYEYI